MLCQKITLLHLHEDNGDDVVLWMKILSQHLSCLRLIQEWQSLPHFAQTMFDTCLSVSLWILLFFLFFWGGDYWSFCTACFQNDCSKTTACYLSGLFYRQLCSIVRICLQRAFLCQLAIQEIPGYVIVCTLRGCICLESSLSWNQDCCLAKRCSWSHWG